MDIIPILSTGQESTVKNWIALATAVFGEDSKQVKFLESRASEEKGLEEPILADEQQLIHLLVNLPDTWEKSGADEFFIASRRNGKTKMMKDFKKKSQRTAQIFKDEKWVDIKPIDIKAGDRFRMFEPNGSPVIGPHGTTSWIASADAFINDLGVVQINNTGITFKGEI